MSIREEIESFLTARIADGANKTRDIQIILFFYGLEGEAWPTLEDTGEEFGIGTLKNRRERPRQIIAENFKDIVTLQDLPSLSRCAEIINPLEFININDLHSDLTSQELIPETASIKGILNLLHDFTLCENFNIYLSDLKVATRATYKTAINLFLIRDETKSTLKQSVNRALAFPARIGIARISDLKNSLQLDEEKFKTLITLLRSNEQVWYFKAQEEEIYLVEDRDGNSLINSLEKIKNVADSVEIDELSIALENGFKRRTPPEGKQLPSLVMIKDYLLRSQYTTVEDAKIYLNVKATDLNPIEKQIVGYLTENAVTDFPSISRFLRDQGFEDANIQKSVFTSPLVQKEGDKRHYTFRLIAATEGIQQVDLYQQYKKRLEQIGMLGTDRDQGVLARKEHEVLTEWLFKGKETENCSICGKIYSTSALITAHKKRRSDCSQNERLDPYIVMPACNYGCDYVYEKSYAWIEDGRLMIQVPDNLSQAEKDYLEGLRDRRIDEKWLKGSDSYFRKPV